MHRALAITKVNDVMVPRKGVSCPAYGTVRQCEAQGGRGGHVELTSLVRSRAMLPASDQARPSQARTSSVGDRQ